MKTKYLIKTIVPATVVRVFEVEATNEEAPAPKVKKAPKAKTEDTKE